MVAVSSSCYASADTPGFCFVTPTLSVPTSSVAAIALGMLRRLMVAAILAGSTGVSSTTRLAAWFFWMRILDMVRSTAGMSSASSVVGLLVSLLRVRSFAAGSVAVVVSSECSWRMIGTVLASCM